MQSVYIPKTVRDALSGRIATLLRRVFHALCASSVLCGLFGTCLCLLFAFVLFKPCYLTNDDAIMKGLLSGTHFYGVGPSEFTLYTSSILGLALKSLYTHIPYFNWYDAYIYTTLSCAVFFIVKTLAIDLYRKKTAYQLLVLIVIPALCGVSFVGVQFTMVAGLIMASGLVVFMSLFRSNSEKLNTCLAKSVYFIIATSMGIMIRDEAALGVGLVGSLFLLPLAPWRNLRKMSYLVCTGIMALGVAATLMLVNNGMTEANPEWKYRKDTNRLYGNLTLHSIFISPKEIATMPPKLLDFSSVSDVKWSEEYQKLLLSWAPIGEIETFNPENMGKVYEHLKNDISLSSQRSIGFRLFQPIESDRIIHHIILLMATLLVFRDRKVFGFAAYQAFCFILVIAMLSLQYREVPYRVWYSYSVLFFSFLAAQISSVSGKFEHKEEAQAFQIQPVRRVLGAILICINILSAYNVLHWQQRHGRMHNQVYQQLKSDFKRAQLDEDALYIVHGTTLYYSTVPCKPNLIEAAGLKKTIILTSTLFTRDFQRQLKKFGLPENETIKSLVERSDVRLLVAPNNLPTLFFLPSGTPFPAMADFMRARYDEEIGMVDTLVFKAKGLAVLQMSVLDAEERKLREQLQALEIQEVGLVAPGFEHFLYSARDVLVSQYAKEYDGKNLFDSLARVFSGFGKSMIGAQT